jgi:hypothetical protein
MWRVTEFVSLGSLEAPTLPAPFMSLSPVVVERSLNQVGLLPGGHHMLVPLAYRIFSQGEGSFILML